MVLTSYWLKNVIDNRWPRINHIFGSPLSLVAEGKDRRKGAVYSRENFLIRTFWNKHGVSNVMILEERDLLKVEVQVGVLNVKIPEGRDSLKAGGQQVC